MESLLIMITVAYQATIPYLLEQKAKSTWILCTGAQGDVAERVLPAMSQGALFSFSRYAEKALADTNIRFVELYLAFRVEVDSSAEQHGVTKASTFGRIYDSVLSKTEVRERVWAYGEDDLDDLKVGRPYPSTKS